MITHQGMGPPLVGLAVPSAFGLGVCVRNPGRFIAVVRNGACVAGFLDGNDYAGGAAALGSLAERSACSSHSGQPVWACQVLGY